MMINLFKLILLLSISIISIESYSIIDADKVKANEAQMIETIKKMKESLPTLRESLNNYQDNPYFSKSFMKKMMQDYEDMTNSMIPLIPRIALEKERDVDDIGGIPVIGSMVCSPDVLEYAPPFILTICSEYNKSGKTTGYSTSGEVLWCVVEGEYYIPEHCKNPQCGMKKLSSIDLPMPPPNTCPNETLESYENRVVQELERGGGLDMAELSRRVDCHYGQKVLNNNSLVNIESWMEAILEMGNDTIDEDKFNQLDKLYNKAYLLPMACALKKCTNIARCNSIGEQILEHLLATEEDIDLEAIGAEGIKGARDLADFVINKFQ